MIFISGRLRSALGRPFDGIFNASFKLFSIKLERNFKKYMNYSTVCFKFTLKLTKISTKYIKQKDFSVIRLASLYFFLHIFISSFMKKNVSIAKWNDFYFSFQKINYNPILLYEIKHLVAFST